jgi:hypothetical protein
MIVGAESLKALSQKMINEASQESHYVNMAKGIHKDIAYHWTLLIASIRLACQQSAPMVDRTVAYSIVRSAGILTEQLLTLRLLKEKGDQALNHHHINMFEQLIDEGYANLAPFHTYFEKINSCSLFSRYPYNYSFQSHSEYRKGLEWIMDPKGVKREEINTFLLETSSFLDMLADGTAADFTSLIQQEICQYNNDSQEKDKKIDFDLVQTCEVLSQNVLEIPAKETKPEFWNWKDVSMHLQWLAGALKSWQQFSDTEFEGVHAGLILTHLQCIDELTGEALFASLTGQSYRTHDLDKYRILIGEEIEGDLKQEDIVKLNVQYAPQYPNRYKLHLKRKHLKSHSYELLQTIEAVNYRLKSVKRSIHGADLDAGYTIVKRKQKKMTHKHSCKNEVLALASSVLNSLDARLKWLNKQNTLLV